MVQDLILQFGEFSLFAMQSFLIMFLVLLSSSKVTVSLRKVSLQGGGEEGGGQCTRQLNTCHTQNIMQTRSTVIITYVASSNVMQ